MCAPPAHPVDLQADARTLHDHGFRLTASRLEHMHNAVALVQPRVQVRVHGLDWFAGP